MLTGVSAFIYDFEKTSLEPNGDGLGLGAGNRRQKSFRVHGKSCLLRTGYLLGPDYKTMKPKQWIRGGFFFSFCF